MDEFPRRGLKVFNEFGESLETRIIFCNGSTLETLDRGSTDAFKLKFSNNENRGWIVTPESLDQLIAELLHIRQEIKELQAPKKPAVLMVGPEYDVMLDDPFEEEGVDFA